MPLPFELTEVLIPLSFIALLGGIAIAVTFRFRLEEKEPAGDSDFRDSGDAKADAGS